MTKILIVDDEAKIRELIIKYARHEGFETAEAADGMEAVELCEKNNYDLVVMDIMMPHLDGFMNGLSVECKNLELNSPECSKKHKEINKQAKFILYLSFL